MFLSKFGAIVNLKSNPANNAHTDIHTDIYYLLRCCQPGQEDEFALYDENGNKVETSSSKEEGSGE